MEATDLHHETAPQVNAGQAIAIAETDASAAYRDLHRYYVHLTLEGNGWHVDYRLSNARQKGGGPHYVIDAHTGAILSKRYEQ